MFSGFGMILLIVQIISTIAIICLVLLQQGKGADMGAAFGSGSAGSLFGSSGSANFLSRMTSTAVTVFFVTTLALTYIGFKGNKASDSGSVLNNPNAAASTSVTAPVTQPVAEPEAVASPAAPVVAEEIPATATTQPEVLSSQTQDANQIPAN